jgi:hypothetical protein
VAATCLGAADTLTSMSDADPTGAAAAPAPATGTEPPVAPGGSPRRHELRLAGVVLGTLWVVGALLGLLWAALSPTQPPGRIYPTGILTTESEQWAATDGRYVIITAIVGLVAAIAAWLLRSARGPVLALALGAGTLGGAQLTWLIGRAWRGGPSSGKVGALLHHLPLEVHMRGLYFVEAAVAMLVYGLCVAFAPDDDLGRPDDLRRRASSVRIGRQPQPAGGYGDGAGPLQQDGFAAQ